MKQFYGSIKKIYVPEILIQKARQFSDLVIPTIDYSDSEQHQISKIKEDHFISKLGEEAARLVLQDYADVKGPDYEVYEAKKKNWNADLFVNNKGVAVKTQKTSAAKKYSLSWTFQSGPKRRDIILDKPESWIIFVEYDDVNLHLCHVYPPFQIKELEFKYPRLPHLQNHKLVVYASTLKIQT
ncbi:MAG: hypothetical protein ACR2KB_16070 [Chitinophagaceae bacterium]|nr:hypothetical protein [Flavisolibacter sp.]